MFTGLLVLVPALLAGVRAATPPAKTGHVTLTAAEQAWLHAHPVVRIGYDPDWPPFSFTDAQGVSVGIDPEILGLMEQRLGLKFEIVRSASWTEAYERAQRGEIDLLGGIARTPEREQHFHFTEPYVKFPVGIITRTSEAFLWSVEDLAGRVIAAPRNYATTTELQRVYPDIKVRFTENMLEAMEMVADGEADATVTNLANASFIIKTRGLSNLKIAGIMPETFELRYAVRQDWPELIGILDKGIASISRSDLQAIDHRWIRVDYAKVIRWDIVWKTATVVLIVLGVVIGFFVWHNRSLKRELAERIRLQAAVELAHRELTRINDDRSALLQMAAHDLRGPLTGMQLVVDSSLRLRALPGDEALLLIESRIRQMAQLLNDILDLEAIETGRRELRLAQLDAVPLLRSVLVANQPEAARKRIQLGFHGLDEALPVQADELALRQIMENLLSNAVKFTPAGGHVRLELSRAGAEVRLRVTDDGPGVAQAEREKIFAKYARGTAQPTAGEKSTGLGLSIVRSLAEAMQGRVWCEEPPDGRGAVFVLVLAAA